MLNLILQHILEHGRPRERSTILTKCAGQIVPMSCQQYASNVIIKCLTYGSSLDRQFITNEIINSCGQTSWIITVCRLILINFRLHL